MPTRNEVSEQLKKAGFGTLYSSAIAKVLGGGETIHAACNGSKLGIVYLVTNRRLITLKNTKPIYSCAHADVAKVQVAGDSSSLRIIDKGGEPHDILLGKPGQARDNFL